MDLQLAFMYPRAKFQLHHLSSPLAFKKIRCQKVTLSSRKSYSKIMALLLSTKAFIVKDQGPWRQGTGKSPEKNIQVDVIFLLFLILSSSSPLLMLPENSLGNSSSSLYSLLLFWFWSLAFLARTVAVVSWCPCLLPLPHSKHVLPAQICTVKVLLIGNQFFPLRSMV